jgi:hypothetical protein
MGNARPPKKHHHAKTARPPRKPGPGSGHCHEQKLKNWAERDNPERKDRKQS